LQKGSFLLSKFKIDFKGTTIPLFAKNAPLNPIFQNFQKFHNIRGFTLTLAILHTVVENLKSILSDFFAKSGNLYTQPKNTCQNRF
jgi:hypothetical protein